MRSELWFEPTLACLAYCTLNCCSKTENNFPPQSVSQSHFNSVCKSAVRLLLLLLFLSLSLHLSSLSLSSGWARARDHFSDNLRLPGDTLLLSISLLYF
jgi:hypothetical protein